MSQQGATGLMQSDTPEWRNYWNAVDSTLILVGGAFSRIKRDFVRTMASNQIVDMYYERWTQPATSTMLKKRMSDLMGVVCLNQGSYLFLREIREGLFVEQRQDLWKRALCSGLIVIVDTAKPNTFIAGKYGWLQAFIDVNPPTQDLGNLDSAAFPVVIAAAYPPNSYDWSLSDLRHALRLDGRDIPLVPFTVGDDASMMLPLMALLSLIAGARAQTAFAYYQDWWQALS